MNRKNIEYMSQDVVFMPAVAPLEASVLPAAERHGFGALHHAKASFKLDGDRTAPRDDLRAQRLIGRRFGLNR